ncbi:hypothetical protein F4805DRAFT_459580 [Annulohypoxylon moriforme]|nr:hypothetical protein F4805DRAFT_459580 [Annulohypoxylon moriforme]
MTKLISSASYELGIAKEEIAKLRAKTSDLIAENVQLKAIILKNNLELPGTKTPKASTSDVRSGKHYLEATKASRNKLTKSNSSATPKRLEFKKTIEIHQIEYKYKDGALLNISGEGPFYCPHFQRQTCSSYNKIRPFIVKSLWDQEKHERIFREREEQEKLEMEARELQRQLDMLKLEEKENQPIEETLLESSGLDRDIPRDFYEVPIRSQIIYDHLRRALQLSQQILYDGLSLCLPEAVNWLQGPHEIQLGRDELSGNVLRHFGNEGVKIANRLVYRETMGYLLNDITYLRNIICHFSSLDATNSNCSYDQILKDVQKLAIFFGDERGALRARSIRDSFIKQVKRSAVEFEALWLLSELPNAYPWRKFHIRKFERIQDRSESENHHMTPIDMAAHHWKERQSSYFVKDWESYPV